MLVADYKKNDSHPVGMPPPGLVLAQSLFWNWLSKGDEYIRCLYKVINRILVRHIRIAKIPEGIKQVGLLRKAVPVIFVDSTIGFHFNKLKVHNKVGCIIGVYLYLIML